MSKKIKRPMTAREIQAQKEKESDRATVKIYNCGKQQVPIHLNAPKGVDFFMGSQDVRLNPKQSHTFRKSRLIMPQIERLCQQGLLQIIHDSEKQPVTA